MAFILVVEDEQMLRTTLRAILQRAGHEVAEVGDRLLDVAAEVGVPEINPVEALIVRPAGRPVDGESMVSGISSSGRFAAKLRTVSLPSSSQ